MIALHCTKRRLTLARSPCKSRLVEIRIIQKNCLQIGTEDCLDRQLPTCLRHAVLLPDAAGLSLKLLLLQPIGWRPFRDSMRLAVKLQAMPMRPFRRCNSPWACCCAWPGLLQGLHAISANAQALRGFCSSACCSPSRVQFTAWPFVLLSSSNRCILFRISRQQRLLINARAAGVPASRSSALLKLLYARLLNFSQTSRFSAALVKPVPLFLPGCASMPSASSRPAHWLPLPQRQAGFLFRCQHAQFFAQGCQQACGHGPNGIRFPDARCFGITQIILQLAQTLLGMLNALLDAGDITTYRIEAPLHQIEPFRKLMVTIAEALDTGVSAALICHQRLKGRLPDRQLPTHGCPTCRFSACQLAKLPVAPSTDVLLLCIPDIFRPPAPDGADAPADVPALRADRKDVQGFHGCDEYGFRFPAGAPCI